MFGTGGHKVGEVYATAGVRVDEGGFREYSQRLDRARHDARNAPDAHLGSKADTSGFRRFDHEMDRTARNADRHSGRIRRALGGIATAATYVGTAGLGFLAAKTVSVASDINESTTKIEQLFGKQSDRIQRFSKRAADAIGLSRQAALAAAGDYGSLFETIGTGDKPAAQMSTTLVKLAQDLASFNNANPQEVLDALKSGLIGEAEPMRRFGALLTETRVQTEAYKTGIADVGSELTEGQKVQARYQLILKDTKAAQGDFARTSGGLANQQRQLSARLTDLGGRIGQWLLPKVLTVTTALNHFVKQMAAGKGAGGDLRDILGKVGDVAREGAGAIGDVVGSIVEFAQDHPDLAKAAGALTVAYVAMRGISHLSQTTGIGRGLNSVVRAVTNRAVEHAAVAIASRGGVLGRLASRFLAPGLTPARPLYVWTVNGGGGDGKPGGGFGGGLAGGAAARYGGTALRVGRAVLLRVGPRLIPVVGSIAAAREIAAALGIDLSGLNRPDQGGAEGGRYERERGRGTVGSAGQLPGLQRGGGGVLGAAGARPSESAIAATLGRGRIAQEFRDEMRDVERTFARTKNRTGDDVRDMANAVRRNAKRIKDDLGENSAAGRRLLAENFGAGVRSIRKAMQDGDITTDQGMRQIRRLMDVHSAAGHKALAHNLDNAIDKVRRTMTRGGQITDKGMKIIRGLMVEELKLYGLNPRQALNIAKSGDGGFGDPDANKGREGGAFQAAGGGVVGRWGERGRDLVHAILGRGEAVLNHAQQKIVNAALAMRGIPGLRGLFSMTRGTTHHMAGGGIAGAIAAANKLENAHFPYSWGGGHQGSPAPFGPMDCSGAVSYVLQHAGVPIPTMVSGMLAGAGKPGPGALTVWANPTHAFMSILGRHFGTSGTNPGGGAGWFPDPGAGYKSGFSVRHFGPGDMTGAIGQIPRILVGGPRSALRSIVQGATDLDRAAANRRLERLGGSVFGGGDVGDGVLTSDQVKRLWVDEGGPAGEAGLADTIAFRESGRDPSAVGGPNDDGTFDHGLYQINDVWHRDSVVGRLWARILDATANTRAAIRVRNTSGWDAWSTFAAGGFAGDDGEEAQAAGIDTPAEALIYVRRRIRHIARRLKRLYRHGITAAEKPRVIALQRRITRFRDMERDLEGSIDWPGGNAPAPTTLGGFVGGRLPFAGFFNGGGIVDRGQLGEPTQAITGTTGGGSLVDPTGMMTKGGGQFRDRSWRTINRLNDRIEDLGQEYDLTSRRADLTEDEFIIEGDEDTPPSLDQGAIDRRVAELNKLIVIRRRIATTYGRLVRYVSRLLDVYRTMRKRLGDTVAGVRGQLKGLEGQKGKENRRRRSALEKRLKNYTETLQGVRGRISDLGPQLDDATFEHESSLIDLKELKLERKPLLGGGAGVELPEWEPPETDTGGEDQDQAAIASRERERADVATRALALTTAGVRTLFGPGDIGAGATTAIGAAQTPMGTAGGPGPGLQLRDIEGGGVVPAGGPPAPGLAALIYLGDARSLDAHASATVRGMARQPFTPSTIERTKI